MNTTRLHLQIPTLLLTVALLSLGAKQAGAALVGHWTFDTGGANLLGDVSADGTDNSGTQTAGTAAVQRTGGDAKIGNGALELFGSQNINVGSSADYDTASWTASMWLWNDAAGTSWRTALGAWPNSGSPKHSHIGRRDNGTWVDFGGGETRGPALVNSTWTHVVSRRTAGATENSIWVNGVKGSITSTGAALPVGAGLLYIGTKDGSQNAWDGRIDDLAYFNEALSDADIGLIYNGGLAGQNAAQALGIAAGGGAVPEPSTLILAVLGLVGLVGTRRRRNR